MTGTWLNYDTYGDMEGESELLENYISNIDRDFLSVIVSHDTFLVVRQPKQQYIRWASRYACGATLGQFLTPAFCAAFSIVPKDLVLLRPLRERLDPLHGYLGIIYDAYIRNGDFVLTEKQTAAALSEYRREREVQ